ncbi:MAG: hypothetical protein AAF827_08005 [Cyanobacteria bacterium P01_D01_bin.6]
MQLPKRLRQLSPTTLSGGETQRVNIARAFAVNSLVVRWPISA